MTENEAMSTLASRLRIAREQAGLSQGQVAKMLSLHRPSISEIEAGRRKVSADELTQLASIYGVSVSWLVATETSSHSAQDARIQLAARQLAKLKPEDFDRVISLLIALRKEDPDEITEN
jgi:transcriptional regulator with XRE-family HTH domain